MTFVSLTDDDLKELGVSTFGARKKMLNAMRGKLYFCRIREHGQFYFAQVYLINSKVVFQLHSLSMDPISLIM